MVIRNIFILDGWPLSDKQDQEGHRKKHVPHLYTLYWLAFAAGFNVRDKDKLKYTSRMTRSPPTIIMRPFLSTPWQDLGRRIPWDCLASKVRS